MNHHNNVWVFFIHGIKKLLLVHQGDYFSKLLSEICRNKINTHTDIRGAGMAQWLSIRLPCRPPKQYGPGSVCCWFLSLLREVFLRVLRFSSLCKTNISKFQFDLETVERRATRWIPLKFHYYYYYYYY